MFQPTVFLVEDNLSVRKSLVWTLQRENIRVKAFSTPSGLLNAYAATKLGCLVLDLRLPEMSGLELRGKLAEIGCRLPFIIITGHGEVTDAKDALRMGAVDFLEKPLHREVFLDRVWHAIDTDKIRRREQVEHDSVQARIDALTVRECEVLELVIAGKLNKQIARQLGISIKTVEAHRSNVTKKMQVNSIAQLVRIVTVHLSSSHDAMCPPVQHVPDLEYHASHSCVEQER